MSESDNSYGIDSDVRGVNPLRARGPVRSLMQRDLVTPSRIVAALLVSEQRPADSLLPILTEADLEVTAKQVLDLGISAVKVFVNPGVKSPDGAQACDPNGLAARVIRRLKQTAPSLCVITDTCLCSFTDHGNCALENMDRSINRTATLKRITELAQLQIDAGADVLGPAPMFDGVITHLRDELAKSGHNEVPLMPHLTWRSVLYKTYRTAMETGSGHQRQGFQIDPSCPEQYLNAARQMVSDGANILQLQPGIFSLDMVDKLKDSLSVPVALYSVSGEYRMLKSLGEGERAFFDALYEYATVAFRSGADYIVTYAWNELLTGKKLYLRILS